MGRRVACVLVYPGAFLCTEDFNERYLCKNSFEYNFYNITKGVSNYRHTAEQTHRHIQTQTHTERHTDTHTHTHTHQHRPTHKIHTETCKDIQKNTGDRQVSESRHNSFFVS